MNKNNSIFIFLIPSVFLIIAPLIKLPYGFYILLRFVVFISSSIIVYQSYKTTKLLNTTIFIFGFIIILFNPIVPIYLSREAWLPIDLIVACIYLFNYFKINKK